MAEVRALAADLGDRVGEMESLLLRHVDAGEGMAVSALLRTALFLGKRLDPAVLCRCLPHCHKASDLAPCFGLAGADAVPALLVAADEPILPVESKVFAVRMAAELSVEHGLDRAPVRKLLWKLAHAGLPRATELLRVDTQWLIDPPEDAGALPPPFFWTRLTLDDIVPERRPPTVIGGDYTVRRPVPKIGRNDPCHCGSGKKYKKCCHGKDQELLRDASAYAGTTRSELKHHPGLVDDPALIQRMHAHELQALDPAELGINQLPTAYHGAVGYGLHQLAFDMLREWERRDADEPFDPGHFDDLIESVLEAGNLEVARRIREHCREHRWYRPEAIRFLFELLEHPERFDSLERACRDSVCGSQGDDEAYHDEPLIRLGYQLGARFPALAIVFARAAIASFPERVFDNETLADRIQEYRVDLDLPPWGDPAEELLDWTHEHHQTKAREAAENEAVARLSGKLAATRADLEEKRSALRDMARQVEAAQAEVAKARKASVASPAPATKERHDDEAREATLRRLRQQVDSLKAEIGEQQAQRRELRRALKEQQRKPASDPGAVTRTAADSLDDDQGTGLQPTGKPIIPEYSDAFRRSCESLPPARAAKALATIGRFAAHDQGVWKQTKPIERLPEHYRIRLGLDYRLIVHWQPGKVLRILDVIPRQGLEGWIKRHG